MRDIAHGVEQLRRISDGQLIQLIVKKCPEYMIADISAGLVSHGSDSNAVFITVILILFIARSYSNIMPFTYSSINTLLVDRSMVSASS